MLVAHYEDELFCTMDYTREQLQLYRRQRFLCTCCQQPLILKIGRKNIPHFAHQATGCELFFSERESAVHLLGKAQLYEFFQRHQQVVIEPYIQTLKQRPDLLVAQKYAIEFQCSTISAEQVATRTAGYLQANFIPLWLLNARHTQLGWHIVKFTAFEQQFFQASQAYPYLLAFHPQHNQFFYYQYAIQLSATVFLVYTQPLSALQQTFPFPIPQPIQQQQYEQTISVQQKMRQRYLQQRLRFSKKGVQDRILQLAYYQFGGILQLPAHIGLYLPNSFAFALHPVEWQLLYSCWYQEFQYCIVDYEEHFVTWAQLAPLTTEQRAVLYHYVMLLQAQLCEEQLFSYIYDEIVAKYSHN